MKDLDLNSHQHEKPGLDPRENYAIPQNCFRKKTIRYRRAGYEQNFLYSICETKNFSGLP
jgi:hypothetical protein